VIRAIAYIETEREDLERYLDWAYGGPPDDPPPEALSWCRDVFGDNVERVLKEELGHVKCLKFRLVSVEEEVTS
jgi:hypothetical protein